MPLCVYNQFIIDFAYDLRYDHKEVLRLYKSEQLKYVIDSVAKKRGLSYSDVVSAVEKAVVALAREKYGTACDIVVEVDKGGTVNMWRILTIVEKDCVDDKYKEIEITLACSGLQQKRYELYSKNGTYIEDSARDQYNLNDVMVGDEILDPLEMIELTRANAKLAYDIVMEEINNIARKIEFDDAQKIVGHAIYGFVRRTSHDGVIIDVGGKEALLPSNRMIQYERFAVGDHVRAYVEFIKPVESGPQIFLSRTHDQFLAKLFELEVLDISDGKVMIMGVARDPGSRAKIAVTSKDTYVDPVRVCVGPMGKTVERIVEILNGEKIDIVRWSGDYGTFVVNAMAPCEVAKVVLYEYWRNNKQKCDVIVPDAKLSIAIGRGGQNVKLVAAITNSVINIMTESEAAAIKARENQFKIDFIKKILGESGDVAQLLINIGLGTLRDIVNIPIDELEQLSGLDSEVVDTVLEKAKTHWQQSRERILQLLHEVEADEELLDLPWPAYEVLEDLVVCGVRTMNDIIDTDINVLRENVTSCLLELDDACLLYDHIKELLS